MADIYIEKKDGTLVGPVESNRLRTMVADHTLSREDKLAKSKEGPWRLASSVKGLFPADVGGPPTKEAASPSQVEEILAEESVNYLFRFAAIGGRMKITTHKVYWRSRDTLEEAHKVDIALADIGEVSTFKKLGLIDNGLLIRTKRGVEYKFICFVKSKRNNLVKILNSETGQS